MMAPLNHPAQHRRYQPSHRSMRRPVMAGLDPAISVPGTRWAADARVKPGHDEDGAGNDRGVAGAAAMPTAAARPRAAA